MQYCAQNGLNETAIQIQVEAFYPRSDKTRRKILGDIGVHAEADGTTAIIAQATFIIYRLRIENEVITMRLLITSFSILDRKSTRLNSSHTVISYAVFCL